MQEKKDFGSLTDEEQLQKLKELSELLISNGLGHIKPKIFDQVVCPLKAPSIMRQTALLAEGSVVSDQKAAADKVKKEANETILAGINPRTVQFEIECKLAVGTPMIDITEVIDINTEEEQTITHKQGQVILLDFWATWCPPCQAPMAHNQEMLEHNGAKWGDRVRIIGISIDQTVPPVQKHVKAKGWEKVEHFHRAGSSSSEDYGVKGVPHVVLIDTNGKIAYIGHPASRKLEQDIETLLKGEALKGVAGGDEDEEDEDTSVFNDVDVTQVCQEVAKFKDAVEGLQKNEELKKASAGLARDFVVLVRETKFESGKYLTKIENINVLVGGETAVEESKVHIQKFLDDFKGNFKSQWRVQKS